MESKKGNAWFVVCLILGIIAILLLLFEGFRYLNDFAPNWYQDSDYNLVKGGLAILIVAMMICLALIYFKKLRILASIGFFLAFLVSVFTIFGLEDNIRSNKNQIAALNEISERHVEELNDEIKQKDEEIENLMASVNQLNRKLSSINVETKSNSMAKSTSSATDNNDENKEMVKNLMVSYCNAVSRDLPYKSGDLIQKKLFFDGKDIIILMEVTRDSSYDKLKANQKKLWSEFNKRKDKGLNEVQIALMKKYGTGLRYRYTHGNKQFDIYFSPKEL